MAGELRVVEAFMELIEVPLADRCRIAELTGAPSGVDAAPGSGQDSAV